MRNTTEWRIKTERKQRTNERARHDWTTERNDSYPSQSEAQFSSQPPPPTPCNSGHALSGERVRERCAQPPWRGILCILFAPSAGCLALLPAGLHCYTPFRVSEIALASTLALSPRSLLSPILLDLPLSVSCGGPGKGCSTYIQTFMESYAWERYTIYICICICICELSRLYVHMYTLICKAD